VKEDTIMAYGTGKYTYELIDGWAKCPDGWSFTDVGGVSVDSQDRVYILSRSARPISVFDHEGNFLTSWGEGFSRRAHGICIGPDGSVYGTDDGTHIVYKFNPDGNLLLTLGNKDHPSDTGYIHGDLTSIIRGGPPFNRPTGVALSSSGEIFVADGYGNARVHKFNADGKLLLSWGEPGDSPGQFRLVHNIWVDKQDRVWVCDRENCRIQIFDAQGKFLNQWTDVIRPTDMFIDDEDTVYVSELVRRVSIFTIEGKLLARWGTGLVVQKSIDGQERNPTLFVAPHTIAVDSMGDLYVGEVVMTMGGIDRGSRTIQKFARIS